MRGSTARQDYIYQSYAINEERASNTQIVEYNEFMRKKYKRERKAHRVSVMKTLAASVIIFAATLGVINSVASNINMRARIAGVSTEIKELKEKNLAIKGEYDGNLDMEYIESYARENLHMAPPEAYQIIYIDVPKESYTIQYDGNSSDAEQKFEMSRVTDFFSGAGDD